MEVTMNLISKIAILTIFSCVLVSVKPIPTSLANTPNISCSDKINAFKTGFLKGLLPYEWTKLAMQETTNKKIKATTRSVARFFFTKPLSEPTLFAEATEALIAENLQRIFEQNPKSKHLKPYFKAGINAGIVTTLSTVLLVSFLASFKLYELIKR